MVIFLTIVNYLIDRPTSGFQRPSLCLHHLPVNFTLVNLVRIFSASMERKKPTGTGAQNIGDLFKSWGQGLGNTGFALGR